MATPSAGESGKQQTQRGGLGLGRGAANLARRAGSGLAGAASALRGQVLAIADDLAERRRASDQRFSADDKVDVQVPMAHLRGGRMYAAVSRDTRRQMWLGLLHSQRDKGYRHLRAKLPDTQVRCLIERDVPRTFPAHPYYRGERGPKRNALYRILCAYSVYDEGVSYCQGMNFVCGMLLMYLEREDEAFDALCSLMFAAGLREYYLPDMDMLQLRLWQLERLLRERCPRLAAHLASFGIGPVLYASAWFLTLFSTEYPLRFASRVLDIVLAERSMLCVMQLGLQLLEETAAHALQMHDFEEIVVHIRSWLPSLPLEDLHEILTAALLTDLTQAKLDKLEVEYRAEMEAGREEREARRAKRKVELTEEHAARVAALHAVEGGSTDGGQAQSAVSMQNPLGLYPTPAQAQQVEQAEQVEQAAQQQSQAQGVQAGAVQYGSAAGDDMLARFLAVDAPPAGSFTASNEGGGGLLDGLTVHAPHALPPQDGKQAQPQQPLSLLDQEPQPQCPVQQIATQYPQVTVGYGEAPALAQAQTSHQPAQHTPPMSSVAATHVSLGNGLDPLGRVLGEPSKELDRNVIDDFVCVGIQDVASAEAAASAAALERARARGGGGMSSLLSWRQDAPGDAQQSESLMSGDSLREQRVASAMARGKRNVADRGALFGAAGGSSQRVPPPGSSGGPPSLL